MVGDGMGSDDGGGTNPRVSIRRSLGCIGADGLRGAAGGWWGARVDLAVESWPLDLCGFRLVITTCPL